MTNYFDDDSFWDDHADGAGEATSQVPPVNRRTPERTRSHHVVTRDAARPPLDRDDIMWVEPRTRTDDRLGVFGSIDPRLLSVGAIAIAAVMAVPLFGALGNGDGGDDGFRSIAEAEATTTTEVTTTLGPVPTEVVVTAALTPQDSESGSSAAESSSGAETGSDSGSASDSSSDDSESSGQPASPAPAALRVPDDCSNTYEAVAGDYWVGIADDADVTLGDLLDVNGASAETAIYPGNDVCLPVGATIGAAAGGGSQPANVTVATESAPCSNVYEPVAGDYWLRIAEASGASLDDLLATNDASAETALYPGSEICLPPGAAVPAPSTDAPTTAAPTTVAPTTEPATTATTATTTTVPPTTQPATTTAPTTEAPQSTAPATPAPSGGEIEQIIRDVWPDELEEQALRIAFKESSYRPDAENFCCLGLFQIYWEVHRSWLAERGVTSRDQLFDARTNAEAAYALYQRSGGFGPWAQTRG